MTDIQAIVHPFDDARAFAQMSLDLLVGQHLAPSPLSYTVAYAYASAAIPEIVDALRQRIESGQTLDENLLHALFDTHIAADRAAQLRSVGHDLKQLLLLLIRNLDHAGQGTAEFGRALAASLHRLDSAVDADALRGIAGDMLDATRQAQQRNDQLQERLRETVVETEQLRGELEEHRRAALVDPLTGLLNRRAMDAHFDELLVQRRAFALLMVDIDHFKAINDTYGHALGDAVIRNVADAIRNCIRGGDHAVRYGGEEFLVMLPDTPLDGASKVAEAIRARIHGLRLVRRRDHFQLDPFTVSVGVTAWQAGDSADGMLQRADSALYASKNSGRNRVSVIDGPA